MKVFWPFLVLCIVGMSAYITVYTLYIKTFSFTWLSVLIVLTFYMLVHLWQYSQYRSDDMGEL